jgi:flagellar biosynthesis protein
MKKRKAVALKYPEGADAPFITASAQGNAAERIKAIAEENDVPVIINDDLVQVISLQETGSCVPEETWTVLAKIFAFIIQVDGRGNGFYKN